MSGILKRLGKLLPFRRTKPVGYDLDGESDGYDELRLYRRYPRLKDTYFHTGNRFFEWPNPAGMWKGTCILVMTNLELRTSPLLAKLDRRKTQTISRVQDQAGHSRLLGARTFAE